MIKRTPEDELEMRLAADMKNAFVSGPYPFEHVRPRLRDRIPPALKWWLFGFVMGVMAALVGIEMFTSIDLGLVPN